MTAPGTNGGAITLDEFAAQFERETTFDLMDQEDRTVSEHIDNNIQWFREWAAETADRLERLARQVSEPQL